MLKNLLNRLLSRFGLFLTSFGKQRPGRMAIETARYISSGYVGTFDAFNSKLAPKDDSKMIDPVTFLPMPVMRLQKHQKDFELNLRYDPIEEISKKNVVSIKDGSNV